MLTDGLVMVCTVQCLFDLMIGIMDSTYVRICMYVHKSI